MRARSILARAVLATSTIALMALAPIAPAHAAPPGITILDVVIAEGDAGTTFASFALTYGGAPTAGVSVDYTTADVTATAGSDYTAVSGTANFTGKVATISVPILGDTALEADETFEVNLSNPVGKALDDSQAIGTITNDDLPHATIDDPSVSETGGTITFTVSLGQAGTVDAVMGYATTGGTATDGSDFTGQTGTLTILASSTTGTIDVPILDDGTYEGNEDLTVDLSVVSGVVLDDVQGLGAITEDDPMPDITVDDPSAGETAGTMTFTISLSAAADADVSVDYATSENTATDADDYTGTAGTATILAGDTSTTVDVAILDDFTHEGDETLNLDLSGEINGSLIDAQGQGTITEDDPAPTISMDSPTVGETDGTSTFTISLDTAAAVDVSVDYTTTDVEASDGLDYTGLTGTATVLAGDTSTTVEVTILDDPTYEGDETFTLDLSNEVNGTIGGAAGTATITDDEAAPAVSIADGSTSEGNSGTKKLNFSVSLDVASAFDVSVDYAATDGTASAGSDYVAAAGTVTILAGDTLGQAQVTVNGDTDWEPDEDLTVDLGNFVGTGSIDTGTATGTIANDDKQPSTLTVRVLKTSTQIKAKGLLESASTGNKVTVTLSRYHNGKWQKMSVKSVSVKKFGDRDTDGNADAQYLASFARPAKGKYQFRAKFAGDADSLTKTQKVTFTR